MDTSWRPTTVAPFEDGLSTASWGFSEQQVLWSSSYTFSTPVYLLNHGHINWES